VVTLTAVPAASWAFSYWSGNLSGSANPTTITMDGNKVVMATFTQNEYTLTTSVVGSGTVTRNPDRATYASGTLVTLTAVPTAGWTFTGWSGDLSGTTNPTTITMNGNKTVTATFTPAYRVYLPIVKTPPSAAAWENPFAALLYQVFTLLTPG
jgi:uncharacterized repeat protein (TIGR02543 family)